MGFFVFFVTLVTIIMLMAKQGLFPWPWKLYFVQTVLWELLNLGVLVAISIIFRPSERAALLAHSLQLTTDEFTEDAFNDMDSSHGEEEEDCENDDDDDDDDTTFKKRPPSPRSLQFEQSNISVFSDVSADSFQDDTTDSQNDFSVDACVMRGDGIEMNNIGQEEEEEDYNALPTIAG